MVVLIRQLLPSFLHRLPYLRTLGTIRDMIPAVIDDAELCSALDALAPDGMHIFIAADGLFRGALFHGSRFVNQMRAQHELGILETMVLGQASLCAALMIQTMKGRESLQLRYETDGAAAGFSVDADSTGRVRGYLLNNPIPIEKPLDSWDLTPFFGNGSVTVSRFPECSAGTQQNMQTGITEIKYRNIARDITWYFQQSEQLYTAFNTGIQLDKKGRVVGAGGLFIQRMPSEGGTPRRKNAQSETDREDSIIRMERALSACPPLGTWFSEGGNCEDLIFGLFREFNPVMIAVRHIVFDCPCSKERYEETLQKLPSAELEQLKSGGQDSLEIVCRNCSSTYRIPIADLERTKKLS